MTLAPTTFCGTAHDGYYSVLFNAMELGDSLGSRPENEARFTWKVSPEGDIQLSRKTFATDSLPGRMRCVLSNVSRFEAWGRVAGDSIGGAWAIMTITLVWIPSVADGLLVNSPLQCAYRANQYDTFTRNVSLARWSNRLRKSRPNELFPSSGSEFSRP